MATSSICMTVFQPKIKYMSRIGRNSNLQISSSIRSENDSIPSPVNNQIEDMYARALCEQLGNTQDTSRIRETPYKGDLAFALLVHCITPDVPPPSTRSIDKHYQLKITRLDHDTAMLLLTGMKDFLTMETCKKEMYPISFGGKKTKCGKELMALGIPYMGQWITCGRDGFYTIHIRYIRAGLAKKIAKMLFEW